RAAALLTGMHDYKSFCGNSHMKKSTVRVVDSIEIRQKGSYIRLFFHGNGFLQNMVRIMTGTLLEVGYGKRKPEDMTAILESRDRRAAGQTAPACGLCLISVDY
ncbi:MAG: tRNA pseudouridine(38-40) synthase TruA, partial [Bilifractor porci]